MFTLLPKDKSKSINTHTHTCPLSAQLQKLSQENYWYNTNRLYNFPIFATQTKMTVMCTGHYAMQACWAIYIIPLSLTLCIAGKTERNASWYSPSTECDQCHKESINKTSSGPKSPTYKSKPSIQSRIKYYQNIWNSDSRFLISKTVHLILDPRFSWVWKQQRSSNASPTMTKIYECFFPGLPQMQPEL